MSDTKVGADAQPATREDRLVEAIIEFLPHAQVAFLWQTKGALPGEVEKYRDAYWNLKRVVGDVK